MNTTTRIALSLKPDFETGSWHWSLAGESYGSTGTVLGRDREDAVISVLADAHVDLAVLGQVVLVLSLAPTARIWAIADDLAHHFPRVSVAPYTEADAPLRDAAMAARKAAPAEPTILEPLTVATDGSASRGRIGWGWLAANGRHGLGSATPMYWECARRGHALLAELRAICEAIAALPGRPLHIRSDSMDAITLIREWMRGGTRFPPGYHGNHDTRRGGVAWMQEQVRREAGRIDVQWVRGHAGDALKEGADSLAKLARRAPEGTWGFTPEDVLVRAEAIAGVFAPGHRQLALAA